MEFEGLAIGTLEVKLEEIEVSSRFNEVQETIWSEIKDLNYFAQDKLHCGFELNAFTTVEGHTSIKVVIKKNKTGLVAAGHVLIKPGSNMVVSLKKYMHRITQPFLEETARCIRCKTKHLGKGCFQFVHQDTYDILRLTIIPELKVRKKPDVQAIGDK